MSYNPILERSILDVYPNVSTPREKHTTNSAMSLTVGVSDGGNGAVFSV